MFIYHKRGSSKSVYRPFRKKPPNQMAFPHPQSGKDPYWQEDKASSERIVWKFFKRIVDITEYRNAEEDVNPAKNPTFVGFLHDQFVPPMLSVFRI